MTAKTAYEEAKRRILAHSNDKNAKNLVELDLTDLQGLEKLPNEIELLTDLETLDLRGSQIADIRILKVLPNLKSLNLCETAIKDLSPLSESKELEYLDISNTKVSDLRPLLKLLQSPGNLSTVHFRNTEATRQDTVLDEVSKIDVMALRLAQLKDYLQVGLQQRKLPKVLSAFSPPTITKIEDIYASGSEQELKHLSELDSRLKDLEKRFQEVSTKERELREGYDLIGEERENLNRHYMGLETKLASALADVQKKLSDQATVLEKKFRDNLAAAEDAFTEQQSIREPVKLWRMKKKIHQTSRDSAYRGYIRGLVAVGALAVLIAVLLVWAPDFVDKALAPAGCDRSADPKSCQGFSSRGFLMIGSILTLFTALLWFVRLQMKIYLAERHMVLDAREREAFAQSYIGLVREGDVSEEAREQRALVYSALFRPASDGTVRDEGGLDPSVAAAISKLLSGK